MARPATKRKRRESSDEGEHRCGCAAGIPTVFVSRSSTKRALNPDNQEWAEHRDGGKITYFQHSRGIASQLGMQTRGLTAAVVAQRLRTYLDAVVAGRLGSLKVDRETYAWFRRSARSITNNTSSTTRKLLVLPLYGLPLRCTSSTPPLPCLALPVYWAAPLFPGNAFSVNI